ncbi:uncharacterized protein ACBR49_020464 [Aulostomus maculatus]
MSSVHYLRQFVSERLTAAAEEIFRVFEKTIIEYEEEIDRQRRLLDIVWKPDIKLHRIDLQQQHVHMDEVVLTEQLLNKHEGHSSLEEENPESLQLKEELCTIQVGEQLGFKQENDDIIAIPVYEETYYSEDQILDSSPSNAQSPAENQHVFNTSTQSFATQKLKSGNQLPCNITAVDKSQDPKGAAFGDSNPDRNAETMQRLNKCNSHCDHIAENANNCQICGKYLRSTNGLLVHIRTHTGEKPYPCNICEKSFADLSTLRRHLRIHSDERPYSCQICSRDFRNNSDLKIHTRVHTGEKPYACNTCGKRFAEMSTLRRHVRIHTGERPYPCNTCEKTFSDLSTLKRHSRIHTGEKPYSCKICWRHFRNSSDLKIHMRAHTGEKPYPCNTCGRCFSHMTDLKKHLKIHMREKPDMEKHKGTLSDIAET